jgi:putative tricarboxylic transport membrane protein
MDVLAGLLLLFDMQTMVGLLGGVGYGLVIGIIPGLGGSAALTILLPFTFAMEPNTAIAAIIGMIAVNTTSDTIPAVLFGVPGTAGSAATVIDGHQMARQGRSREALGASYASSMLGGIFGAALLAVSIPIVGRLIPYIGSPVLLSICILGLSFASSVSGRHAIKGLASACLGILVSLIGLSAQTAEARWTFGSLYLWDGVPLVPLALAVFALPSLISIADKPFSASSAAANSADDDSMMRGVRAAGRHWFLILRSGWIGSAIGAIPGLGGSIVDWIAYGSAVRTARDPEKFGTGDIRGVIAPEGANNAKDGGALIPTITLGVPGSPGMALVLAAFTIHGIVPGVDMLSKNLDQTYMLVWGLVLANIVGAGICLFFTRYLALLVQAPAPFLIPAILTIVFMGAFQASVSLGDLWLLVGLGALSYFLMSIDWPLPPFILGVVLGEIIERYLFLSLGLYGWGWALQPVPLTFLLVSAYLIVAPLFGKSLSQRQPNGRAAPEYADFVAAGSIVFSAVVIVVLAFALREASKWSAEASTGPLIVGSVAVALLAFVLIESTFAFMARLQAAPASEGVRHVVGKIARQRGSRMAKGTILLALMFLYVVLSDFIGMLPAIILFIPAAHFCLGGRRYVVMAMFTLGLFAFVYGLFDKALATPWEHPVFPWVQHFIVKAF